MSANQHGAPDATELICDDDAPVELHWAAVPFPREDQRDEWPKSGRSYSSSQPIMVPAELVEELGFEELITFVRLTFWHQCKEAATMRRLADEVWFGELERAAMWVSQLERRGLVACSEVYQRALEKIYPELYEQRVTREAREKAAAELAERRRQERERRDEARAQRELRNAEATKRAFRINLPTEEDGSWAGPWPLDDAPRPPKGQPVVYVLYGSVGRAVYVGSTDNFLARMKAHQASGKRWTAWTALPCESREEAFEVEGEYLAEYMPHFNVQGPQFRKGDR